MDGTVEGFNVVATAKLVLWATPALTVTAMVRCPLATTPSSSPMAVVRGDTTAFTVADGVGVETMIEVDNTTSDEEGTVNTEVATGAVCVTCCGVADGGGGVTDAVSVWCSERVNLKSRASRPIGICLCAA